MRLDLYLIRIYTYPQRFGAKAWVFKRLWNWHKHAISHRSRRTAEQSSSRGGAMTKDAGTKWFDDKLLLGKNGIFIVL